MKAFLLVIFLSALAIITAVFLHQDAGSVQVEFQGNSFSAPLVYVFFGIIGAFLALYFLLRIVGMLFRAPSSFGKALNRRAADSASERLITGTLELNEGKFTSAEKQLIKDVPDGSAGTLHYIAAAEAANARNKPEQRDSYLKQAVKLNKSAKFGIDLNETQRLLGEGEAKAALEIVRPLVKSRPKNSRAFALLGKSLAATNNWSELNGLLPDMRKRAVYSESEIDALEAKTGASLLASSEDAQLESSWKNLTNEARELPVLLSMFAKRLQASGQGDAAERTLRTALNKEWKPELLKTYAMTEAAKADQQLSQLQKWIEEHGENSDLLAAAGQVSVREELWGKAHSYLEQAAQLGDSAAIQQALAKVADNKGDAEASRAHLEQGLNLALNG